MSIKGRMFTGKLESLVSTIRNQYIYATLAKVGSGRVAVDVVQKKYAQVSTANVVLVGSTDNLLKKTAHGMKEGYQIRLKTTANSILEEEILVESVVDANTVRLAGYLSATLTAGDTFDIYKPVSERVGADGSSLSTLIAPPIQITKEGVPITVNDSATPANIVPVPVKIVDASGNSITINAGDINVNLSDMGANYDRTRIGDGVNQLGINANSEAKVHDADMLTSTGLPADAANVNPATSGSHTSFLKGMLTQLLALVAKDFATSAKQDTGNTSLGSIDTKFTANNSSLSSIDTKLTSQATAAKQDTGNASLSSIDTKLTSQATASGQGTGNASLSSIDTKLTSQATAANQTALNTLVGATNEAAPSTDTGISGLNGRLQRVAQNVTSLRGQLPTALGQTNKAGSLSVTIASDNIVATQEAPATTGSQVKSSLTNTGTAAHIAPASAIGFIIKNSGASDGDLCWEIGAAASAVSFDLAAGQGSAFIPFTTGTVNVYGRGVIQGYVIQWFIK